MENPLYATASALEIADKTIVEEISAENLALADCVIRILDTGILKLQTALLIPIFLDDNELLKQCFSKSDLKKVLTYYNVFMQHAFEAQHEEKRQMPIALIDLIDIFCKSQKIKEIVPEYVDGIPEEYNPLISSLRKLHTIAENKLKTTAASEMQKEKAIHRIYKDNVTLNDSMQKQKKQLKDQEIKLRFKLAAKQALIKKYEEDLEVKKWENNLKIKQEILKSSHKVRDFQTKSQQKQEMLSEDIEKAKLYYNKSMKSNLKAEKEARDEKNKVLLQLIGLIKKYDTNIADKIRENEELQVVYDKQRAEMDEFLVGYYIKEAAYNELADYKATEEENEFRRRLTFFMQHRSAIIIQRYWRKYWKAKEALEASIKVKPSKKKKKKK